MWIWPPHTQKYSSGEEHGKGTIVIGMLLWEHTASKRTKWQIPCKHVIFNKIKLTKNVLSFIFKMHLCFSQDHFIYKGEPIPIIIASSLLMSLTVLDSVMILRTSNAHILGNFKYISINYWLFGNKNTASIIKFIPSGFTMGQQIQCK